MSNAQASPCAVSARPRVVFLGMPCPFSAPPLAALITAPMDVAAVVLPGPHAGRAFRWHRPPHRRRPTLALTSPAVAPGGSSLISIAHAAGVPLLFVGSIRSGVVVAEIERLAPDAIVVACFPERLPEALLRLAPLGALNVHPSLLPRDRGPSPLFWAFHRRAEETGVTVHLMEETLDTGPIVRQARLPIPEGVRLADVERELAHIGAGLLVEAIRSRAGGDLTTTAQDPTLATSASFPTAADRVVDPASWSAARAVGFVRGMGSATVRLPDGDLVPVDDAVRWDPITTPETALPALPDGLVVAFPDGRVAFRRGHGGHPG